MSSASGEKTQIHLKQIVVTADDLSADHARPGHKIDQTKNHVISSGRPSYELLPVPLFLLSIECWCSTAGGTVETEDFPDPVLITRGLTSWCPLAPV